MVTKSLVHSRLWASIMFQTVLEKFSEPEHIVPKPMSATCWERYKYACWYHTRILYWIASMTVTCNLKFDKHHYDLKLLCRFMRSQQFWLQKELQEKRRFQRVLLQSLRQMHQMCWHMSVWEREISRCRSSRHNIVTLILGIVGLTSSHSLAFISFISFIS